MGRKREGRGFTLVELLVAIAVIGILISMLIPAVSKVMENARRAKGANCLKQIATAYTQYMSDDVNGRTIQFGEFSKSSSWGDYAESGVEWAIVLARRGYLNDPSIYSFSGDSAASRVKQKSIVKDSDATATTTEAWDTTNGAVEFSVYVIAGIPVDAPLTTTPIAFTRGIPENGKWKATEGVYKDKGGYIAFLDGHVEWFEDLGGTTTEIPGKLVSWGGDGTTNDILKAIPSTAHVLSASKDEATGKGGKEEQPVE